MFLDISRFSMLTDALMVQGRDGAEVLATTMRAVFDPIADFIFVQSGMIVGYAGDSISALFPTGADEAAAAWRVRAAACSIEQTLAARPFFETPYGKIHISAKISLSSGTAEWGILRCS